MPSPISNWFVSLFFSSHTLTPSKHCNRNSLPSESSVAALGEKHLSHTPPSNSSTSIFSHTVISVSPPTSQTESRLTRLMAGIEKLSRSWLSFLHKGNIQDSKPQKTLSNEFQDKILQDTKETFSKDFQSTFSISASNCARSLHEIYTVDPREAATLFLSEAQSNPTRAAQILLAAKATAFPKNRENNFVSLLISQLDSSLSPKQIATLIHVFSTTLAAEIKGETRETLFRADGSATIPLFRCIATQILRDVLPKISKRKDQHKTPKQYWEDLSNSLSQKTLEKESTGFFRTFRNAIQEKLDSPDETEINRRLLSILTNRCIAPSIMSNKTLSSGVMKEVNSMSPEFLTKISKKLTG